MESWADYTRRERGYVRDMAQRGHWYLAVHDATHQQGEGKTMATQQGNAMNYAQAREAFVRLKNAGFLGTIRQRSWDTEGLYFAVELTTGEKLYREADVDAFLAARAPVDTEPYDSTTLRPFGKASAKPGEDNRFFRFRASDTYRPFLPAPDGSPYWSMADIRRAGGVAISANGRRHRLGERKFVPFVAPQAGK
jgi:hypothetical protein